MFAEVRAEKELIYAGSGRGAARNDRAAAGLRLLGVYAALARRRAHLLDRLLAGRVPKQWAHYPDDDAIDAGNGYQWFYHSHAPEDRRGAVEHGHIHLFARRALWARRLQSRQERKLAALQGRVRAEVNTRHLLGIGLDARGIPVSLFTVNSWVTGDLMLGAENTELLLKRMKLNTGYREIDKVIECVVSLCEEEIRALLLARDRALFRRRTTKILQDKDLEILSELPVDLDWKIRAIGKSG